MQEASVAFNRFGLGAHGNDPAPDDVRRWLNEQLQKFDPRPADLASQPPSSQIVTQFREARDNQREYKEEVARLKDSPEAEMIPKPYRGLRDIYVDAAGARASVALSSPTPFAERLVHFWSNHFAISIDKLTTVGIAGAFEFEAIRPNVMGSFSDLLLAVSRHPGMLLYLDQAQSIGPASALGQRASRRGNKRGLNENLAREVLELHTLGVRTGYTQADVTELARALTGWTVGGLAQQPALRGPGPGFFFLDAIHEPGDRTVLGKRYAQSGEAQARAILQDLAAHPATARHIATKLARHFAADDPPAALVSRLERRFMETGGNLPSLYRALVEAPEVWTGPAKFRTPWDWTIATLRAVQMTELPAKQLVSTLNQLGQAVWKPGSPAGYDDVAASWAGPDALMRRVEVAGRLAKRTGANVDARALADRLFPGTVSSGTRQALQRAESGEQALALLLASPEMMRR